MSADSALERPLKLYAWGYDQDDMEMLAESLTEDAELFFAFDPLLKDAPEERSIVGRPVLLEHLRKTRAAFTERNEQPFHLITNVFVERASEQDADLRCVYQFCSQSVEGLHVYGINRYFDHLVRDGAVWRIRRRRNVMAPASGRLHQSRVHA